jgi:hypothetical protein
MTDCPKCHGTGVVVGEPRGHDEDGNPLFVRWGCDCMTPRQRAKKLFDRLTAGLIVVPESPEVDEAFWLTAPSESE